MIKLDDATLDRLNELYEAGLARMPDAIHWYDDTLANIQGLMAVHDGARLEDNPARTFLFVDLLASTSPRCSIIRNTFLASQVLHFINEAILCDIRMKFQAHLDNICRSLLGLPLSGQKVLSFQANLLGDMNAVTVDTWMMKAFGMDHDNPSPSEYDAIARATRKFARQKGIEPSQMQAAVWVGIKALDGDPSDTPEPFERTLARFKQREDAQGLIDFTGAEGKFLSTEDALSKQGREVAANPGFRSPLIVGPRLREICRVEAGLGENLVDLICAQGKGDMMEAILFCRENIGGWLRGRGDPVSELEFHLNLVRGAA